MCVLLFKHTFTAKRSKLRLSISNVVHLSAIYGQNLYYDRKHKNRRRKIRFLTKIFSGKFVDNSENLRIISFCMDMKNNAKIPSCGKAAAQDGGKIIVGSRQLRKALLSGSVQTVYLAKNADPYITEPVEILCREMNIQPIWVSSKADLGRRCGIEVGAAAAAVVR